MAKTITRAITGTAAVSLLAAILYALTAASPHASAAGITIGYDMDPTGNSATTLGTTDRCRSVNPGEQFTIDTFINEIPAGTDFSGFSYTIGFDDTRVRLVSQDHNMILATAPGSSVADLSNSVPDTVTPHDSIVADFGTPEVGPIRGVLGRYIFEALPSATTGTFALTMTNVGLSDSQGNDLFPNAVQDGNYLPAYGLIAVGQTCPASGADLALTKTDSPDPVQAGQQLTYILGVANNGPFDATSVVLTDTLPASVTYASYTASQGSCSTTSGVVTCNLGTILNANSASVTITVNVSPGASGSLSNTASVSSAVSDPLTANNSATETTFVGSVADLSVAITDAPDPVLIGSPLAYSLTVFNSGPSTAIGVSLTDNLPSQVAFSSYTASQGACTSSAGTVNCSLGTIAPGSSANVTINTNVTTSLSEVITNTASVTSAVTDPTPANNSDNENTFVRNGSIVTVVGVDLDATQSPANAATSLGSIQTCRGVVRGQNFDVDIFVNEVPAGRQLAGFSFNLNFDPTRATLVAQNTSMILAVAPGSSVIDLGDSVPSSSSPFIAGSFDLGPAENGPLSGVLVRYTFHAENLAPAGLFNISLADVSLGDPNGDAIPVDQVQVATVAIQTTCPTDTDGDGIPDSTDNCPSVFNPSQFDIDFDGLGDDCDPDKDNDGIPNAADNCPTASNPGQEDFNANNVGDACDDTDSDGVADSIDNCVFVSNPTQLDTDGDQAGDACDSDKDGDGIANVVDNCPGVPNTDQADINSNNVGDVCEDSDGDGIFDASDNCPLISNPTQADMDADNIGDACDSDVDGDGVNNGSDACMLVREDLDGIDDADGCPDVDSSLQINRTDPVFVGINVPSTFSIDAIVGNGNVMASATLTLQLDSTVGACEARWTAGVGDFYSETTSGSGPTILHSMLTIDVSNMSAAEQRTLSRSYSIACVSPGSFSIDMLGGFVPVAPVLEESTGTLPSSYSATIPFTAFQAADIQIQSYTGPDELGSVTGNQILIANGTPKNATLNYAVVNSGPFSPADVADLTSVADVDANADSSVDCVPSPHDQATNHTLSSGVPVNDSAAFTLNWQDLSPPPTSCSLRFVHAAQVTNSTARDTNATSTLADEQAATLASLGGTGSSTSAWTSADASSGSQSVQLSFSAGAGNVAAVDVLAGVPLTSVLDLRFDYSHISGGQLPDTSFVAPNVALGVDCDNNGLAEESIVSSAFASGTGDPVAGHPGWLRVDMVDSALDSWYVPGVVPSSSPVTLANAVAALQSANANCGNGDPVKTISLQYGDATATAGTARVDNLVYSGAERSVLTIDLVLDQDGDGVADGYQSIVDNCPTTPNPSQADLDNDGQGDACDADTDGDGVADATDNCPSVPNPSQADFNGNNIGDACDDADLDGVVDATDNCRTTPNPSQTDTDGDSQGDACDPDDDNDLILDGADACSLVAEDVDLQSDTDGCPDSNVNLSVSPINPVSVDVGASNTFHVDAFVTNGNYPSDVAVTITLRAPLGVCAADWVTQGGDTLSSGNIDTNFDTIPDTYFSTINRTLSAMAASEMRTVSRDYQLVCSSRGSRSIDIDVSVAPVAPVVEENSSNNSYLLSPSFSVYDVSDIQLQTFSATDGLPSRPGTQILVGPLPPVVGSASPVSFGLAQSIKNNGPYGPTDVNSGTVAPDIDANGDLSTDCDIQPNTNGGPATISNGGTFSNSEPYTVTWLNNTSPPFSCTATFTKTVAITTPFVRDPNAANNSSVVTLDFVRDTDNDTVPDNYDTIIDNCPTTANTSQSNVDGDALGDACDPDIDADGILNASDNCPSVSNPTQADLDNDGIGDACDSDRDNDGVANSVDNCPNNPNPLQQDVDGDNIGDACDDSDLDGVVDATDNCIAVPNPSQSDIDGDGRGDACDSDRDGDGVVNTLDNCPNTVNPGQQNNDGDSLGDACDPDDDNDTVPDVSDACVFVAEDLDGIADSDGCPDTNASVAAVTNLSPSVDLNVPATFNIAATVTNGNAAASLMLTLTLVSDPRTCSVHLIAQAGDTLNEFAEDTDFDTINDRFTSTIQRTQSYTSNQSVLISRNYLVTCAQNGLQNLALTAGVTVLSPVLEENAANNTQSQTIGLQSWGVADLSTVSMTVPDDWPAVPANGAPETNCNNYFDDDADTVINDGCPGLPGNQVLIQAGAAPHIKYPTGVPAAPRNFNVPHVLHDAGPFSPVSINTTYAIPDADADNDTAIDCDSTPNSQTPNVSVSTGSDTTSSPPLSVSWLDAAAPPQSCSVTLNATLAIASPYVRDPNAGNNDSSAAVDFVRDSDGDLVPDNYMGIVDNCPTVPNPDQISTITPGIGDACDPDFDFDGVDDNIDNCVGVYNPGQADTDGDGQGDACDPDDDNDGLADANDNCPLNANANQADFDGDGAGDACDPDDDNDEYSDTAETRMGSNPMNQASTPEACDGVDDDGDGIIDEGFDSNSNGVPDCNDAALDTDNDGLNNNVDTDDDGDGFTDLAELYMRTNPLVKCVGVDVYPMDLSGNGMITITDVSRFILAFGSQSGQVMFDRRLDFNQDSKITISDVSRFSSVFGKHC